HLALRRFQPEVPCLGEQIATIELWIRNGLFDDEHLDPQLQQLIKSRGVKDFGPDTPRTHIHERTPALGSSCNALVPQDHTSSYSAGSSDSSVPSDGTISWSLGLQDRY